MLRNILAAAFIIVLSTWAFSEERAFTVAGDSMTPALMPGDRVIVDDNSDESIKKGDLVAIKFKHTETPIVKRVIAVEGDRVEIKSNTIFVNEKPFRYIDENRWKSTVKQLEHYSWVVPPNNIFVLGDNPKNSRDSRRLGLISTNQVSGKVIRILHSEAKPRNNSRAEVKPPEAEVQPQLRVLNSGFSTLGIVSHVLSQWNTVPLK